MIDVNVFESDDNGKSYVVISDSKDDSIFVLKPKKARRLSVDLAEAADMAEDLNIKFKQNQLEARKTELIEIIAEFQQELDDLNAQ